MKSPACPPASRFPLGSVALALLFLFGASACRLGANNTDKLSALKAGAAYDEDGILAVEITSPSPGFLINAASNSSAYSVSGTCTHDSAPIALWIDQTLVSDAGEILCSEGAWSSTFDSNTLSEGAHLISASIVRNGQSQSSAEIAFTKNATLPNLAILSPAHGGFINASANSATFAVSGSCSEAGQTVSVKVDGAAATSQNGGTCNGATWAATIDTLALAAGVHTLQASIVNAGGNANSSEPVAVTQDILTPTASISAPSSNSFVNLGNNSATFAVSGACNDATASVQVQVNGTPSGSAVSCGGSTWNASISTVALGQGAHTLTARITDPAGNAAVSGGIAITKDTAAPAIAITSPAANSYVNLGNNSATFSISGSCSGATDIGRAITIQVNGAGATQSAITCGAGSTWSGSFSTVALSDAGHTLSAQLSDAAGNSSTSATVTVIKDTGIPSVTLTRPGTGALLHANNASNLVAAGTCSENGQQVSVKVDGSAAALPGDIPCGSGSFSVSISTSGLGEGAHTITAAQTDAAGNTGPATPATATITKNSSLALGGTFSRTSAAYDPWTGALAASGVPRYTTLAGATGILLEENVTNILPLTNGRPTSNVANGATPPTVTVVTDAENPFGTEAVKITYPSGATAGWAQSRWESGQVAYSATVPYTRRIWIKGDMSKLRAYNPNLDGNTLTATGKTIGAWAEYATTGGGPASFPAFFGIYVTATLAAPVDIWVAAAQIEQRGYSTSTMSGGRSAESLIVPLEGSILPSQGAVVVRAYVDGDVITQPSLENHFLFRAFGTGNNFINLRKSGSNWIATLKNDTQFNDLYFGTALTQGWHTFGLRWSGTEASLWHAGTKKASTTIPQLPANLGSNMHVGSSSGTHYAWNNPIDYAAFYQHSPSDAEMIAYTTTGPTDADNRLDFSGASFTRTTVAHDPATGVQAASGKERYATVSGQTGILIEEGTTNLITANQSNIETDGTGLTSAGSATLTRDTTTAWEGAASLKVQTPGAAGWEGFFLNMDAQPQGTYTGSAYLKGVGSLWIWVRITYTDNSMEEGTYAAVTLDNQWRRYSTRAVTTNAAKTVSYTQFYLRTNGAQAVTFYADGLQFEQKAFATSWQVGGGTRNCETFALPVSQMPTSDWTVEFNWIPKRPAASITDEASSPTLIQIGNYHQSSSLTLRAYHASGAEPGLLLSIRGQTGVSGTWSQNVNVRASGTGWYAADTARRIALRCTGNDTFHVFVNGVKYGPYTIPDPVTSWSGSTFRLSRESTSSYAANAVFDELRISSVARADADLQNYTNGSTTIGWDTTTSVYLPFSHSIGQ